MSGLDAPLDIYEVSNEAVHTICIFPPSPYPAADAVRSMVWIGIVARMSHGSV